VNRFQLGQVVLVGLGGFVGSAARYVVSVLVQRVSPDSFPYGTLVVNVAGCLAIGFLGGLMETRQLLGPGQRLFLLIGVLGGFTTYSTFAYETLGLTHMADFGKALLNVAAHVVLGMAAAWLGYLAAEQI